MIEATAVVMLTLWLAGIITAYTIGGFIHILLVIAVLMVHVRIVKK